MYTYVYLLIFLPFTVDARYIHWDRWFSRSLNPLYQLKSLDFHSVVLGSYYIEVVKINDPWEELRASFVTVDL